MHHHAQIENKLGEWIRRGHIKFGGNSKLKIYGMLNCRSGKRMHKKNRVFFQSEAEAVAAGYRPCGNCLKMEYQRWKLSKKRVE